MISPYACLDVRERLEAFHDGELSIDERIAFQQHISECSGCSSVAAELASISDSLRELAAFNSEAQPVEALHISDRVVERLNVEAAFSIRAQVSEWFQDMHLVWAGLGASMATAICVIGSASVLHAANQERPNSMARVIAVLASPGSNENPIRLNYEMTVPGLVTDAPIEITKEEGEYTLSAVVSREGRVQGVRMINQPDDRPGVNAMLNEAYRMKFAPATARDGDAVAVSILWLVSNTTVKGRHDIDLQALRQALKTQPAPIAPLPLPSESEPKPQAAPLLKPIAPDSAAFASAAAGGLY